MFSLIFFSIWFIEQIKINQTCHEVDSVYNEYEKDFINVLNKHAPIKSRYQRKKPLPCMNQELRRAGLNSFPKVARFCSPQSNVLKSMFSLIFFSIWLQNSFSF
jgi:hypothetical protein